MKPTLSDKMSRKNGYQSDDDNIRYKINSGYTSGKSPARPVKKTNEDEEVRYMFPTVLSKPNKPVDRKPKPKIKVNFWSNKPTVRLQDKADVNKVKSSRRHTIAATTKAPSPPKAKSSVVKVRKRVSFLPSPLFMDNHIPMVTVPDDLTIQLNEEEANDLAEDLNHAFLNSNVTTSSSESGKRKNRNSMTQTSPKRKRSAEDSGPRIHGNENELEFFSKYVVQKLRRMETNQRIYSENLINTVLMLGQLGKLNGKSKIGDA